MDAPGAPVLSLVSSPQEGVEVYFPTLHADGDSITVWRVADGLREEVRGAKRATVAGDFVITDFEVPFGVPSTYVGELFDAAGASVLGAQSSIQVDSDEVRFSDPVDPERTFTVILQASSLQGVERETHNRQVWVAGVPRPFNQWWGEGALTGVPLEVWSRNDSETQNLKSLSGSGQWLIRTPPLYNTLPRLLYVSLRPPRHAPQAMWSPNNPVVWVLTVDEVQPVSKAVMRPLVTWDDWEAAFPAADYTWNQVMAIYGAGTWTDAQRNPPTV